MMKFSRRYNLPALVLLLYSAGCATVKHAPSQPNEKYTEQAALRMLRASREALMPVYAPLAEQIVTNLSLQEEEGIGIDFGSGPGTLILELCERSRLHWINADINPHFYEQAR